MSEKATVLGAIVAVVAVLTAIAAIQATNRQADDSQKAGLVVAVEQSIPRLTLLISKPQEPQLPEDPSEGERTTYAEAVAANNALPYEGRGITEKESTELQNGLLSAAAALRRAGRQAPSPDLTLIAQYIAAQEFSPVSVPLYEQAIENGDTLLERSLARRSYAKQYLARIPDDPSNSQALDVLADADEDVRRSDEDDAVKTLVTDQIKGTRASLP